MDFRNNLGTKVKSGIGIRSGRSFEWLNSHHCKKKGLVASQRSNLGRNGIMYGFLAQRFCPWALIGAASKHLYSTRDPVPPLQHFMAWYRRRRKYYLSHDANETESPGGTLSCVLRGTPTYNYTLSFTLHSSSSKTRIWLLTRRGARERSPYDFFFYGVGVRDQIRWLLPVPPMGSR